MGLWKSLSKTKVEMTNTAPSRDSTDASLSVAWIAYVCASVRAMAAVGSDGHPILAMTEMMEDEWEVGVKVKWWVS